jgi:glycosyltransferase involved in cell wall biosynthesis
MTTLEYGPLVSVIVPVYNGAEYVGQALESALCQTYPHLEVLAIDDGSSDGSLGVLELYAAKDSRVRVLRQHNGGVASARNRCIEEARGELIATLDADDLWQPTKIERQVRRLLEAGDATGFVYCWWAWIDGCSAILDRSPRWMVEGEAFEALVQINFTGNASVPLFRKRCVVEAGGYDPTLAAAGAGGCEDWELVLRIASRYHVAVVPEILLGYRRLPGSMSTACNTMWRSKELVIQQMQQLRPDIGSRVWKVSNRQFALYLAGLSFWSGRMFEAFRWAFRSGWSLSLAVAPHVLRMLLSRVRSKQVMETMLPNENIHPEDIPGPLLPYDSIYSFPPR